MTELASLETFSGKKRQKSNEEDFSIYDVPGASLDIRFILKPLLKHADNDVRQRVSEAIELLTKSIRAMGKDDIGLVDTVGADSLTNDSTDSFVVDSAGSSMSDSTASDSREVSQQETI